MCFNPVRICGVRGPTKRCSQSSTPVVSIRCGFVGSGDSTPVCGGAELGKRGALRQPLLGCGPVMRWSIMSGHWNRSSAYTSILCANLRC